MIVHRRQPNTADQPLGQLLKGTVASRIGELS
jgi:hypothetical protein